MARFEQQDSAQTLAEGLAEYHAANPGLLAERDQSPAARAWFRSHDVAHVVFGCGTSLPDEAAVKIASLLGTTAGLGVLRGYRLHEARRIYRRIGACEVAGTLLAALVVVPRTAWRCLRQRRHWPWDGFEAHAQQPLAELRRAFGITVARPRGRSRADA